MDHTARLNILLPRSQHDALQRASKRCGLSMGKLIDIGLTDLLGRIAREGAVVLPLRDAGEFRVISPRRPPELEQGAASVPAIGAAPATPSDETAAEPAPAAAHEAEA
jgi:hypothetical protein